MVDSGKTEGSLCHNALSWLKPAAYLWLIFLSLNLSRLCGLHFHVDNEISALRIDPMIWLEQGRWGAFVIEKFILPHSFVVTFPLAIFGISGAFSYLLFLRALGRNPASPERSDYLLFPFFIAFPSIVFLYSFTANIAMQSVAMLLAAFCCDCFSRMLRYPRPDFWSCALIAIWGCFCISIYQANFLLLAAALLVPVLAGIYVDGGINRELNVSEILKQVFLAISLCLLAALLYWLAQYNWLGSLHHELTYIPTLYDDRALIRAPVETIMASVRRLIDIVSGAVSIYGAGPPAFFLGWAPLAAFAAVLIGLGRNKQNMAVAALTALLWIVFWLSPAAFGPLMNIPVPVRSIVSLPVVLWFTLWSVLEMVKNKTKLSQLLLGIVCCSLLGLLYINCYRQSSAELIEAHDRVVITQIASRLAEAVPDFSYADSHRYKLVVSGVLPFANIYGGSADDDAEISLLQAKTVTTLRVHALLRTLGLSDFDLPSELAADKFDPLLRGQFAAMPSWPARGCIKVVDDQVLLKLGELEK